MAGDRRSDDPLERIEWQLNQIRQSVAWVAALAILALIGAVLMLVAAAASA